MVLQLMDIIKHYHHTITDIYIGMATGLDCMMGLAVLQLNKLPDVHINLWCCIPGQNQTKYFSSEEKRVYQYILSQVSPEQIVWVNDGDCTPENLKSRNRYMVDHGDELISFWSTERYKSGTYSAMMYGKKVNKPVYNVHPFDMSKRAYYHHPDVSKIGKDEII
jgi:uncharacterized phage-like protein YoqJ